MYLICETNMAIRAAATTNPKCRQKMRMGVELRSLMAESPMVLYTATSEMTDSSRKMTHRALSPANMFSFLRMLGFVYSSLT